MPLAGEIIVAGQIPGERIATTTRMIDSAGVTTTETVVDTVTAAVVIGRTYRVRWIGKINTTVAGDDVVPQVREDSIAGTIVVSTALDIPVVNRPDFTNLETEYTADATEDKTFVATIDRVGGTGTLTAIASALGPTYLYVDYIRG